MALALQQSGNIITNGSEQQLFSITSLNHFACYIFAEAMQSGDELTIRVQVLDDDGATLRKYLDVTLVGLQASPAVFIPFLPTNQYRVTIQRVAGADRSYSFSVYTV